MNWNITSREIIRTLKKDGWFHIATDGDHWQFKHTIKKAKSLFHIPKDRWELKPLNPFCIKPY